MLLLVLKSEVNATYCLYYCYKENPALFAKFITKHRQCATFLRNHINSVMNPVPTLEEEEEEEEEESWGRDPCRITF
jgi:hypothetical protein